jgi:hypothetical protein
MPEKLIVDWTDEFDRWLAHAEEQGGRLLTTATAVRRGSGAVRPPRSTQIFGCILPGHTTAADEAGSSTGMAMGQMISPASC